MKRVDGIRRLGLAACVATIGVVAGACAATGGGGASTPPSTTQPAPGANVDPNSNNFITGPVNKAKSTVQQQNQQLNQEQQQSGGG